MCFQGGTLRHTSVVFDIDTQWRGDAGFERWDYRHAPEDAIRPELRGAFDGVVIDPPFICDTVWRAYAAAARLLLAEGGKIVATTVAEKAGLLKSLLGLRPAPFRPAIPNLVYQYDLFLNFEPTSLGRANPEVDA